MFRVIKTRITAFVLITYRPRLNANLIMFLNGKIRDRATLRNNRSTINDRSGSVSINSNCLGLAVFSEIKDEGLAGRFSSIRNIIANVRVEDFRLSCNRKFRLYDSINKRCVFTCQCQTMDSV